MAGRKRRFRKLMLLSVVLGCLCLMIAGGMGLWAAISRDSKPLVLAGIYGGGALFFFALRIGLGLYRARRRARRSSMPLDLYRRRASGSVLISVLVLVALVAGLVVQAQFSARHALRRSDALRTRFSLDTAARDALRRGMQMLADDETLAVDSLQEAWAEPLEWERPEGTAIRLSITDLNRYFDLNNLYLETGRDAMREPEAILAELFSVAGQFDAAGPVDALADWVDPDSAGFYEADFYADLSPAYAPADRFLWSWQELFLVEGFSPERFQRRERFEQAGLFDADLVDCVTLLPVRRRAPIPVNINTASEYVLTGVLGVSRQDLVNRILAFRESEPIPSMGSLRALLQSDPALQPLEPWVATSSRFFEIAIRAYHRERALTAHALVERDAEGTVRIHRWVL